MWTGRATLRRLLFCLSAFSVKRWENEWLSNFFCRKDCSVQRGMKCSGATSRERSVHSSSLHGDTLKHPFHPTIHCNNCIFNLFLCLWYYLYVLVSIGFCPNTMIARSYGILVQGLLDFTLISL